MTTNKKADCWQKIIKSVTDFSRKSNSYTFKPQAGRKEFSWFLPLWGLSNSFSDMLFLYKFCSDFSLVLLVVCVFLCLPQAYLCYLDLDLFFSPFFHCWGWVSRHNWLSGIPRRQRSARCTCAHMCACMYMRVCTHTCVCACVHVCVHVRVCMCVWAESEFSPGTVNVSHIMCNFSEFPKEKDWSTEVIAIRPRGKRVSYCSQPSET